ncbi:MAG: SpoIIE family protein phosphatase [Aliifodinibius sp.]|nr:SpoIIE family protein phosphatase [Fodinibius sp.]
MQIQIGVTKINKYASSESGDTLEVVERPNGGLSVVLADGQRSGKSAKRISNMVVRKVVSLLAEGVRDGPAARAASDYLYSMKGGKVLSTLNILSIDLETSSLVISRNNPSPIYYIKNTKSKTLDEPSKPVGVYRNTKPIITELPLQGGLTVVAFTDGLITAGHRKNTNIDIPTELVFCTDNDYTAQQIADHLIELALDLDDHRPIDDVSIVVLNVSPKRGELVRKMSVLLPIK